MELTTIQTKRCPLCGQHKPLDKYQRSGNTPDGRHTYCSACSNKAAKERSDRNNAIARGQLQRQCKHNACITMLSRYNKEDHCSIHARRM